MDGWMDGCVDANGVLQAREKQQQKQQEDEEEEEERKKERKKKRRVITCFEGLALSLRLVGCLLEVVFLCVAPELRQVHAVLLLARFAGRQARLVRQGEVEHRRVRHLFSPLTVTPG